MSESAGKLSSWQMVTASAAVMFVAGCTFVPLRAGIFAKMLRGGRFASSRDYSPSAYNPALAPELTRGANMMLIVGTKGLGKSFAASHLGAERVNTFWIDVTAEHNDVISPERLLEFMYDASTKKHWPLPFETKMTTVPAPIKQVMMERILSLSTMPQQSAAPVPQGKKPLANTTPPTVIFDVHSGCRVDASQFMGAIKVLCHDKQLMRAVLVATEGMEFSKTNDDRWNVVTVKEVPRAAAAKVLDGQWSAPYPSALLDRAALTALNVTGGPEKMADSATRSALQFLDAFGIACDSKDRKQFAEQALAGFNDPHGTALNDVFEKQAKEYGIPVDQWFHNRFVQPNVMAKYGNKYEFQFAATRHLAEKLVTAEGDVVKLKATLREEGWLPNAAQK